MSIDQSRLILDVLDQLDAVFRRYDQPGSNTSARRQVGALTSRLKGHHSYITEKSGQIQRYAEQFYSERAYLKYPGGGCAAHGRHVLRLTQPYSRAS